MCLRARLGGDSASSRRADQEHIAERAWPLENWPRVGRSGGERGAISRSDSKQPRSAQWTGNVGDIEDERISDPYWWATRWTGACAPGAQRGELLCQRPGQWALAY